MKKLGCKELDPSSDCHFVAEGETKEEVIGKIFEHSRDAHPEKLAGMSEDDKNSMMKKMNDLLAAQV